MKKMLRTAAALLLGASLMSASALAATTTNTFSDVPSSHWGYTFVNRAAKEGIVSGIGNGKFGVADKLSNAQFIAMVCNAFYKDDVMAYQNQYKPADWWRSYMGVAYTKKLLTNTTVADSRAATNVWSAAAVNADISRYDMAQIMANVAQEQGWDSVTTQEIANVRSKIADWSKIPAKYQTAVAVTYAKGFLSGMDSAGTFQGDKTMTRTEGAVVMCKLLDAKGTSSTVSAPTYTNTTGLVNGKTATEENVVSALAALKKEFPNSYIWNVTTNYKSPVLGNSTGSEAFAYMLADRVFGNLSLNTAKTEDLKPGDIVHLSSSRIYAVVEDVYKDEFSYVACNSTGKVTWGNTYEIDDLTSWDTIYTRYKGTGSYSSSTEGELSNGDEATEKNVASLLANFKKRQYSEGDYWDMEDSYKSSAFSTKKVYGSQAFAYYLSDEIFGDLEVNTTKLSKVRVGDVIYLDDEDLYVVVTDVDTKNDTLTCVYTKNSGYVTWKGTWDMEYDLDSYDKVYTRYPDSSSSSSSSSKSGTLTNNKKATETNVAAMLADIEEDDYWEGYQWNVKKKYSSSVLGSGYGSEAFAYTVSDDIFGDLDYTVHHDSSELKVGDVVCLDEYGEDGDDLYVIVTQINTKNGRFYYAYVDEYNEVTWKGSYRLSSLDKYDDIYTRYP